jgi:hypothetical protein
MGAVVAGRSRDGRRWPSSGGRASSRKGTRSAHAGDQQPGKRQNLCSVQSQSCHHVPFVAASGLDAATAHPSRQAGGPHPFPLESHLLETQRGRTRPRSCRAQTIGVTNRTRSAWAASAVVRLSSVGRNAGRYMVLEWLHGRSWPSSRGVGPTRPHASADNCLDRRHASATRPIETVSLPGSHRRGARRNYQRGTHARGATRRDSTCSTRPET